MLSENGLGKSHDAFGMPYDSLHGSDGEYVEGEECDSVVDIPVELHDDDCLSDYTEEMLLQVFGSLWAKARDTNNGEGSQLWNPDKAFCGAEILKDGRKFLPESEIECPEDEVKEFICSYMYEYIRTADSQTLQDVDEKWIEDSDELKMDLSRVEKYQAQISELLLISPFFAALDNHFGLAEFVPVMYDVLKEELRESYDFIFCHNDEIHETADIYNSQEGINIDEAASSNDNDDKEIKVIPDSVNLEQSSMLQVLDNKTSSFPSIYNTVKWSTEDGVTKQPPKWDVNTIVKQWNSNGEQSESVNGCVQNESPSLKEEKILMSDGTLTALTELLAPINKDYQVIWTGLLKWTALDNKAHAFSCSLLCSSRVKHVKLSAGLWPQEMTMQLVSRDFIVRIGFDLLCQLSDIVTFKPVEGDSDTLAQDLGSEFAGFIVNKTPADTTFIVVVYFKNTETCIGLAPHQSFMILSGLLADFCHKRGLEDKLSKNKEIAVQTEGVDYDAKLKSIEEVNKQVKMTCDDQLKKIESLSSSVKTLQTQQSVLQLQLETKTKECFELSKNCSQKERGNADLQDKVNNLEKRRLELDSKVQEQVKNIQDLESRDKQHKLEKQGLEERFAEKEKKWSEGQDQMKITIKRHELSEKLLNKKVEAVEETNKSLRDQLNSTENAFKDQLTTLKEHSQIQNDELIKLRQKLAEMEQRGLELEVSNEKLKTQESKYQEQHRTRLQEMWNCKFEAVNREAMIIQECCKRRIEELTQLASAVGSSGNAGLHNEVSAWHKIWQSCLLEAVQQQESLKETYTRILESIRLGEAVTFPDFNINLPSQPQNIVDVVLKINSKKVPLLPAPLPLVVTNPSHFAGNPVYYPPFTNSQLYLPQPSAFAPIPGINLVNSQRHIPSYPGNQVNIPEPVPELSSTRIPKAPFTALQNTRVTNINAVDAHALEEALLADKVQDTAQSRSKVDSPPPLTDANSLEQQEKEKRLNTASRLMKTVVQQSLASSKESSTPVAAGVTTSTMLLNLQAKAMQLSTNSTAPNAEMKSSIASKQPAASKQPPASKPVVSNTIDSNQPVPVQPKSVAAPVSFMGPPAAPTMPSNKLNSVPIKTLASQQQPNPADISANSNAKPPSLLDLQTKMPSGIQAIKVQQNPKGKSANFQKLLGDLRKKYPNKSDEELEVCVALVRERNNNKLTGLPLPTIITMVGKVLQEQSRKKEGSMGLDKFGTTAWNLKSAETVQWSKPKDTSEEECTICIEPLGSETTTLYCKHSFHTSCIRKWLRTESVCPICRVYTRMADEFPPLG